MKQHYSSEMWQQYKDSKLPEALAMQMESHLYNCPFCLETFLGLISQDDMANAEAHLSEDFTKDTMHLIGSSKKIAPVQSNKTAPPISKRKLFGYYVTAAAVTLMLMSGGVFQQLVDGYPRITAACTANTQIIDRGLQTRLPQEMQQSGEWLQNMISIPQGGMNNEIKK